MRQAQCARIVQRYVRGYLGRKQAQVLMSTNQIEATWQYFQKIKRDMETSSLQIIVYYMRKHLSKMNNKRWKAAAKKKVPAKKGKYK